MAINSISGYESPQATALANATKPKPVAGVLGGKTSYKPGMGPSYTNQAVGVLGTKAGQSAVRSGLGRMGVHGTGGLGAGASMGVGIAGEIVGSALKPKEEMPIYGGQHGDILDQYGRRFEGAGPGTLGGAARGAAYGTQIMPGIGTGIGALVGMGIGAATRNATSAFSDFSAQDGAQGIRDAYTKYLGRQASDDEVMTHMKNVGYDASKGHRWLGDKPAHYILDQIAASPEAQAYQASKPANPEEEALQKLGSTEKKQIDAMPQTNEPVAEMYSPLQEQMANGNTGTTGGMNTQVSQAPASNTPANPANPAWNTDGYATPGYTASKYGDVMAGWDATKWGDANHQTPKYVVGRILSNYAPTVEGLGQAVAEIQQAYPGATFNGKDKVTIPGVGTIDVLRGASVGGQGWQWLDEAAQGGQVSSTPLQGQTFNLSAPSLGTDTNNPVIQYLLAQLGLDRAAGSLGG